MPKTQAGFPKNKDVLIVDRQPRQKLPSTDFDIVESAITQIEAELRRTTDKYGTCTLETSDSGIIKVEATEDWILTLPGTTGLDTGLPFLIYKADDNKKGITLACSEEGETIAGEATYLELNYQNSWVYLKSNIIGWDIVSKSRSLDMGTF